MNITDKKVELSHKEAPGTQLIGQMGKNIEKELGQL